MLLDIIVFVIINIFYITFSIRKKKIQKVAFRIILEESYTSYEVACTLLNLSPLQYRRTDLCTKFAVVLYKSPRSTEFFTPAVAVAGQEKCDQHQELL